MLNTIRTAVLMAFLIAVLAFGGEMLGGSTGMIVFASLGVLLNIGAFWFSDKLALKAQRARPLGPNEAPELHRIVAELAQRAGMPVPPIYLIPSSSPNAFATGRSPKHAAVAVTAGLLDVLDAREIRGVLAHELSHVRNRDILVATVAAGIAGTVATLGHILQWGLLFGGSMGQGHDRGSGVEALVWIIIAPIIALLLQLAISRTRESGADISGAKLSGDPGALADALEKIEAVSTQRPYEYAGPATAHLFIINPMVRVQSFLSGLLSTHPPTASRVARLRAMERH